MSELTFPNLPGLAWDITVKPLFNTLVQEAVSGREVRAKLQRFPRWEITLNYPVLRIIKTEELQNELERLQNFYLQMGGAYDDFLVSLPDLTKSGDWNIQGSPIGIGDGQTSEFLLTRPYGQFMDWVQYPAGGIVEILVAGNQLTQGANYTFSNGYLSFNSAPALNAQINASFIAQWRCRFNTSEAAAKRSSGATDLEFNNFSYNLWECKTVNLITVLT